MNIVTDLEKRYTTKRYDSTKRISDNDMDTIKRILQLSPSSINSQPWKFIILESEEAKKRLDLTFQNKFQFNRPHILESSHIILFCHNPEYSKEDYYRVIDQQIADGRLPREKREEAFGAFFFADLNRDENGNTEKWTKSQLYLALGNLLHGLARLNIDSTVMEGIDGELINREFTKEIGKFKCDVALAIGYHNPTEDYNKDLPKSRLTEREIISVI